jgi:hypothetical protein
MSSLGQWFFEKEKQSILRAINQRSPYVATVNSVNQLARTLTIIDPFTGGIELEELAYLGEPPEPGMQVMIDFLRDGGRVAIPYASRDPWIPHSNSTVITPRGNWPLPPKVNFTVTPQVVYYVPVYVRQTHTVTQMQYEILTVVNGSARVAIYDTDYDGKFLPRNRLTYSSTTANGASTGIKVLSFAGVTLQAYRWYWLAIVFNTAVGVAGVSSTQIPGMVNPGWSGSVGAHVYMCAGELRDPADTLTPPTATYNRALPNTYIDLVAF